MSTEQVASPPAPEPAQQQEPKKKSIGKRILMYVVGLVVAGVAIYGINYFGSDAAQTKAGDCASITGTESSPNFKTVDCGAAEANYTVGKTIGLNESCGEGSYDEYTETARRGPKTKLCLVPKFVEGECYDLGGTTMGYPKAACGSGEKVAKVAKVIKDAEPDCGEAQVWSVPQPKIAYCLTVE